MSNMFGCCVVLVFALLFSHSSYAWGVFGHRVVAYIAEDSLTLDAKNNISKLLALENTMTLARVAMWADKHRAEHPELPDHMVRIPLNKAIYNEGRDCPAEKQTCVVRGLKQQIQILKDHSFSDEERLQALKLVVHFLGDIHQPLHASEKTGTPAVLNGQNLTMHGIWDTQSVGQFGLNPKPLSKKLEEDFPNVLQGTPEDWVNEGHEIALKYFKPLLDKKEKGQPIILPDDYLQTIAPIIELRLQQAGVRLGRVLNEIFDTPK